ncbi:MAG: hypothetical protein IAE79_09770 [Anaerolinea sp.]|nr:hypothetical protein [Anaerolinea sp.]
MLEKREPHFLDAAKVWTAVDKGNVAGYLAAHSITTLFYIMQRRVGAKQATTLTHANLLITLQAGLQGNGRVRRHIVEQSDDVGGRI